MDFKGYIIELLGADSVHEYDMLVVLFESADVDLVVYECATNQSYFVYNPHATDIAIGDISDKGDVASTEVDSDTAELLNTLYPLASLRQLALCYHAIMETNDGIANIANCKRFFQLELKGYDQDDMQRFNLTVCSSDQVMSTLANPASEEIMNAHAELMMQQMVESPDARLLQLNSDVELSENDIKFKVEEFLAESLSQLTKKEVLVVGSIILISNENANKYIYMFNVDTATRTLKVYRTKGKRPADEDILSSFQSNAERIGFDAVLYEDIPRNGLINNYPELLLGFTINRMMVEMEPFETVLRQMTFSLLPFIFDDGGMTGQDTENNGGTRQQIEDDEFEEIGNYNDVVMNGGQVHGGNEESEDVDFDDDDFDDIVDDF